MKEFVMVLFYLYPPPAGYPPYEGPLIWHPQSGPVREHVIHEFDSMGQCRRALRHLVKQGGPFTVVCKPRSPYGLGS